MKRTLLILLSILLALFVILSVLGLKGEYAAEKAFFRAQKKLAEIHKDPLAVPDARFNEVVGDYRAFMKKYPDSRLAILAHMAIGGTYMLKKDYEPARDTFERIIQQYSDDRPEVAAQALKEIAATYSQENKMGAVVRTYERIISDYPLTERGLAAPLTLARIQVTNNPSIAGQVFDRTIAYYRQLQGKDPRSVVGFKALNYVASSYMAQKKWRDAVNVYGELLLEYSEPEYLNQTVAMLYLRSINTLAIRELKDFDLPISIYGRFIQKYPQHPLSPVLDNVIQGIKELKQQELQSVVTGQ